MVPRNDRTPAAAVAAVGAYSRTLSGSMMMMMTHHPRLEREREREHHRHHDAVAVLEQGEEHKEDEDCRVGSGGQEVGQRLVRSLLHPR